MTADPSAPLVVIGDSLLDLDIAGTSDRLSPEAPVPVVDVAEQYQRPGGAGLAALLAARGDRPVVLITAIGADDAGRRLAGLLGEIELIPLPLTGSTVCKTRVAAGEPLLRLDFGSGRAAQEELSGAAATVIRSAGAILVSDYGRGVTGLASVRRLLAEAAPRTPIVWDPHPRGTAPVPGVTLATPNAAEAAGVLGPAVAEPDCGQALRARWQARGVAVTVGARGAWLSTHAGTVAVPVPAATAAPGADTCGAGDQFAAAAANALLAGADLVAATEAGVRAASAFVAAGAAATVSRRTEQLPGVPPAPGFTDPFDLAARIRAAGGRLVAAGGCFDLLHPGHVALLERARRLGDALVVCLNSDASVRRAKGAPRPLLTAADRTKVLAALAAVDAVAVFDEDTPADLLARLRPDVWVKGADYADAPLPEAAVVESYGGKVVLVPTVDGYSTTRLANQLRGSTEPAAFLRRQEIR